MTRLIAAFLAIAIASHSLMAQNLMLIRKSDQIYVICEDSNGVPRTIALSDIPVLDWTGDSNPSAPSSLAKEAKSWAEAVNDPAGAQRYAMIFAHVCEDAESGNLSPSQAIEVLSASADAVLGEAWSSFRIELTKYNVREVQQGRLSTGKQVARYCKDIYQGLNLASPDTKLQFHELIEAVAAVNTAIDQVKGQQE